jgi:hypothetical protein
VGKVVQPLQSANCHDSRAHGHKRYGPFTQLAGYGWVGSVGFESSCVWFVVCSRCEAYVHGSWFGYRWDACDHGLVLATGVTPGSLWPLITMGNLGVWSCLDVI